ncbi:MAG: phage major capsid protein [Actinomycetota bacterium]|nr:phage major capsid protein [Actinomycetota bacterium]
MTATASAPERRTVDVGELRTEGRTLHGLAAPYNSPSVDLGGFTETIASGAFADVLRSNPDVHLTLNHESSSVLGRTRSGTLRLRDTARGLEFDCDLPDSPLGHNVREAVGRGDITGASFRFVVGSEKWEGERRTITSVADLRDVTVATRGAYAAASVELRSTDNYNTTEKTTITDTVTGTVEDRAEQDNETPGTEDTATIAVTGPVIPPDDGEDRTAPPAGTLRVQDRTDNVPTIERRDVLGREDSMRSWGERRGLPGFTPEAGGLSFDRMLRGMVTGDWGGADAEQRAVSESPLTAGGHMVPTPVAASVIDKARAAASVFRAGAQTVPMTSQTLKYARLTSEPTPGWRNEGAAINDQAMVFDAVTFQAQTMALLVKCSLELFEDAPNTDDVIANSFAMQIALELDRVALRGSGTSPEPRGVRNQTGVTLTSHGANGDTIANLKYNMMIDALAAARASNFEPNAIIDAPRTEQGLSKLVDTTGQYITPPAALSGIPRLATNQIPINITVGTSTDTSEVYTGDWSKLLIGIRTGLTLRFLGERFIDNGQYAFLAYLRGDVQLAQPAAFVVDTGVRG